MTPFRMNVIAAGLAALAYLGGPPHAVGQERRRDGAATISVVMLRVPEKARKHFEKARAATIDGRNEEYERELASALALDPEFGEAYLLRASRKVVVGQFEEAIADVLTAQRLEPSILWATIVHAEACNGLRRYDEAFALLDGLKPIELGTWQAKYEMTRAVVGRRDAVAALQWSKLALDAVPGTAMPSAILLRANALQMAQRWPEAVEQFDKYLALPGTQPMRAQVTAVRDRVWKKVEAEKQTTVASQ